MNSYIKNYIRGLFMLIVFVLGLSLVIIGHKEIGPSGLGLMLLGLAFLISLLWLYNRKYK